MRAKRRDSPWVAARALAEFWIPLSLHTKGLCTFCLDTKVTKLVQGSQVGFSVRFGVDRAVLGSGEPNVPPAVFCGPLFMRVSQGGRPLSDTEWGQYTLTALKP